MPTYTGNIFQAVKTGNLDDNQPTSTSVINSDSSFSATLLSGTRLLLPDTNIENSAGTVILEAPSCTTSTLPDKTVRNSAGTNIGTAIAGVDPVVANITLTHYDGTTSSVASGINLTSTQLPRTYAYPAPTGMTSSLRTGDDAWVYANIYNNLTRGYVSQLTDFVTLTDNNSFGNTNRFTGYQGNQTFTGTYCVDNYTALGWYMVILNTGGSVATWSDTIDAANALSITVGATTYSDFFLPNLHQLNTIMRKSSTFSGQTLNYAPFNITGSASLWVSTSVPNAAATNSFRVTTGNCIAESRAKTESYSYIACRRHF